MLKLHENERLLAGFNTDSSESSHESVLNTISAHTEAYVSTAAKVWVHTTVMTRYPKLQPVMKLRWRRRSAPLCLYRRAACLPIEASGKGLPHQENHGTWERVAHIHKGYIFHLFSVGFLLKLQTLFDVQKVFAWCRSCAAHLVSKKIKVSPLCQTAHDEIRQVGNGQAQPTPTQSHKSPAMGPLRWEHCCQLRAWASFSGRGFLEWLLKCTADEVGEPFVIIALIVEFFISKSSHSKATWINQRFANTSY